jgi:uncharacterized protein
LPEQPNCFANKARGTVVAVMLPWCRTNVGVNWRMNSRPNKKTAPEARMRLYQTKATLLVLCLCGTVCTFPAISTAQDIIERTEDRIIVSGTGKASAKPDMAEVNIGVVTQEQNAAEAVRKNNQLVSELIASFKADGIADKDLQTSQFDVSPVYQQDNDRARNQTKIVAYRVSNQLHVRVRVLDKLGATLDRAVGAGANQINGISFHISDTKPLADQSLQAAVADARRKAQIICDAAGVKLGTVLEIRESQAMHYPVERSMMTMSKADSVPIESGEQTISANVQITFSITNSSGNDD